MNTIIEVFFVHITKDWVRWRSEKKRLEAHLQDTPDTIVQDLVQCCNGHLNSCQHRYLSHSTSWRFEAPSTLILSYIVYPQDQQFSTHTWQKLHLHDLQLTPESKHDQAHAPVFEQRHVLSHALRHLALLAQGPTVNLHVRHSLSASAKHFLSKVPPALAGQLL